jgi:hypothetical protein
VVLQARNKQIENTETVKIRYGPYKIPSAKTKNVLGEGGTLFNYPDVHVQKYVEDTPVVEPVANKPRPCERDCMVLGINAGLEYPSGKNANIDNGLWLHHMVRDLRAAILSP